MYRTNNLYAGMDMRRNLSTGADERASYAMSGPQSISTMTQNSPATPHTNYDTEYDDSKNAYNGEMGKSDDMSRYLHFDAGFPTAAYQQSLQDVFPDQSYSPGVGYNRAQQSLHRLSIQSQRSSMMADRLHAAQQDHLRTESPAVNSREKSPFRQNSPYIATNAQRQQAMPLLQKQRTSISPKELMLDEREIDESSQPLFTEQPQPSFFAQRRPQSNLANFYVPGMEADASNMQAQHQFPMFANGYRQGQNGVPDMTPEFPAHLVSMESTADESASEPSSQQSNTPQKQQSRTPHPTSQPSARPVDTSSDAGTYSCTYHGCTLRFDSPTKLQKHKREGHRQLSPGTSQVNLALRNSQAGPHRCDRINPSTGKPCNSVFSRPYDLTRHEDTIHNARKQKVRCPYCTEEKTFSRADALTRHLRVVHPDIQPQMKQRRARK